MIKRNILVLGMIVAVMLLAGCANPQPYATPSPTPMPGLVVTPVPAAGTPAATLTPTAMPEGTPAAGAVGDMAQESDEKNLESAKAIQAEVDKMSEVDKSSVLVMGDTALVGVRFAEQYRGELTSRIRDMIIEKAEAASPAVKKVAVTADADQYKRVEDLATRVGTGTPLSEISLEISELVNGLLPRG